MARVAAMSRRGFHQAFVDHIGRTPAQEMNRIRIDTAKRLLHESEDKVETVGAMCGYKSANSFSLAFKRTTGISPKHYRDSGVL
jgi:transcriptional regulator GlxA family with amidase domain